MNPYILVLDMEFRSNKDIKDIGVAFIIDDGRDGFLAAKPEKHYLIRLGASPKWSLKEACFIIEGMNTKRLTWASYGTNDRHELKRQTENLGLEMPVGYFHLDIAPIYASFMRIETPIKLKAAAEAITGRYYGSQHHADDDAWNAARVLAALLNRFNRE